MRRKHLGADRAYKDDNEFCRGVSFLVDRIVGVTNEDKYLESWKKNFTKTLQENEDGFIEWMQGLADFGTLTHEGCDAMLQGIFTTSWVDNRIEAFVERFKLSETAMRMAKKTTTKNVLSFRQFLIEHDITVYATEQMVKASDIHTATPIDIVGRGQIQIKKGGKAQDAYILANIKTSESAGRFPHHKWQCLIEAYCAIKTLLPNLEKNIPITVGRLRTVNFRGIKPTFDFKPYWFINFENGEPIITAYEGESADDAIDTVKMISKIIERSGGFNAPVFNELTWDGALGLETSVFEINYFNS